MSTVNTSPQTGSGNEPSVSAGTPPGGSASTGESVQGNSTAAAGSLPSQASPGSGTTAAPATAPAAGEAGSVQPAVTTQTQVPEPTQSKGIGFDFASWDKKLSSLPPEVAAVVESELKERLRASLAEEVKRVNAEPPKAPEGTKPLSREELRQLMFEMSSSKDDPINNQLKAERERVAKLEADLKAQQELAEKNRIAFERSQQMATEAFVRRNPDIDSDEEKAHYFELALGESKKAAQENNWTISWNDADDIAALARLPERPRFEALRLLRSKPPAEVRQRVEFLYSLTTETTPPPTTQSDGAAGFSEEDFRPNAPKRTNKYIGRN